jgi:hypothetical protein
MEKITLPKYLRASTKAWMLKVLSDFDFEEHQIKLLIQAGETLDRIAQDREQIKLEGAYYTDKWGQPHCHPALNSERNNRIVFARLLRELNLQESAPDATQRPPRLKY